jgi:hypothetical protein
MYVRVTSGTGLQAAVKGLRAAVDAVAGCDLTLATGSELGACQMVCVAVAPDEWSRIDGCDH